MPVDRERAVAVGLRLLDADGLDRLTVRRLAAELGVRAPALYWHFESKRALLDAMADTMLAPVVRAIGGPRPGQPWWQWLEEAATALRDGMLAHRDGGRVASDADLRRARALGWFVDRTTGVLHQAGFGLADASRAAGALLHFVIGRAIEDQSRPEPGVEREVFAGDFPFPYLARSMQARHAQGTTPDDDFRYALGIMTAGLRALHAAGRPDPASS